MRRQGRIAAQQWKQLHDQADAGAHDDLAC
jgi:hypothetical protein